MEEVSTTKTGVGDRMMLSVDSRPARWMGMLVLAGGCGWLILVLARNHHTTDWHTASRPMWSLSVSVMAIFAARGILLGRPVTVPHTAAAAALLSVGLGAHLLSFGLPGDGLVAGAGLALTWPMPSRRDPAALPRVWALIEATHGDPLAPFAMHSMKSYYFDAEGGAAIAYRTRLGLAVVSGDPIGQRTRFPQLVRDFAAMCHSRGWRIVVLGCSEQQLELWRDAAVIGQSLRPVPIGRDVVIDVGRFSMVGRKYRNLRQAVQRTHNAGITTEIVAEQELEDALAAELAEVLYASHRGAHVERGFSMILDHALEGRYPGIKLIIARDRGGRVQGFQRYATSGGGSDVTLDVPWRRPGAPNGIDERLSVDMIYHCRKQGGRRVSLAFAAFPEIFDNDDRSPVQNFYYALIHLGRSLIRLESLYRYLRKFHAFGQRRYVLVSRRHIPIAFVVLLSLEFLPRRRHLPRPGQCETGSA
ncbi:MAG: phosphatidylglycerol lysyltransferase domain-containing protein [Mycobacterium sp.]|uniref:bifunctional lysylphosphatidylglycerol flippase/synthetase MprF n=1 Tax=Mycobacterium sp. TaxID=1785 RepID=UPI00260741B6|nr:phosphatidylglycerol lysyltransferase domain-containing protein [Mycobacterium sp.]MDI3315263.1 phosphatidylglycerol lysyltransferase domain-containing protein [Mycobacterium sp.]